MALKARTEGSKTKRGKWLDQDYICEWEEHGPGVKLALTRETQALLQARTQAATQCRHDLCVQGIHPVLGPY